MLISVVWYVRSVRRELTWQDLACACVSVAMHVHICLWPDIKWMFVPWKQPRGGESFIHQSYLLNTPSGSAFHALSIKPFSPLIAPLLNSFFFSLNLNYYIMLTGVPLKSFNTKASFRHALNSGDPANVQVQMSSACCTTPHLNAPEISVLLWTSCVKKWTPEKSPDPILWTSSGVHVRIWLKCRSCHLATDRVEVLLLREQPGPMGSKVRICDS